jgi:hypothetical protein
VKDRLDLPSLEARDQPAGLFCRDSDKVNVSARRLRHHLGHDGQRTVGPGAADQPGSGPRELLVGRERRVPELARYGFEGFFFRLRTAPWSMTMSCPYVRPSTLIDPKPEPEESHIHHVPPYPSVRKSNTSESRSIAHSRLSYLTGWSLGGSRVEPSRRTTGPTGADTLVGGGGVGLGSGGLSGGTG